MHGPTLSIVEGNVSSPLLMMMSVYFLTMDTSGELIYLSGGGKVYIVWRFHYIYYPIFNLQYIIISHKLKQ